MNSKIEQRSKSLGEIPVKPKGQPLHSVSEPTLSSFKRHPLFEQANDSSPYSYHEFLFAAETLENIVNDGTFVGTIKSKFKWFPTEGERYVGRDMSDRVLMLVYGTMKYLPYIDIILVKTQFLVFNNQFLDSLGLVKVMTYDLMKHHFEYKHYPGVDYTIPPNSDDKQYQQSCIDLVRDLDETLRSFEIKLGAAYARLRIERGASGSSAVEQMEKILPVDVREKEDMAVDMPKTLRINQLKTTKNEIINNLRQSGFKVAIRDERDPFGTQSSQSDSYIRFDSDFDDLLIIPQEHFATLKASPLVNDGYLIFQDKASMYCPRQLSAAESEPELHIIDARSGCGTKIPQLSIIAGKKGHIFAFENRSSRLETLKLHLNSFGCKNVTIVEEDFSMCDTNDPRFEKVSTIIVEPVNSGTTIVDKLGFMLQEEEYPVDSLSQKDLYSLKRRQVAMLKHAFKFPNVKNILYMTRSTHSEENEQVVQETLDRYGVEWKLECVLPDIPSDRREDDIDECLTINPSDQTGNGIFVANFKLKPPPPEKTINELQHIEVQQSQLTINDLDRKEDFKSVTRRKRKSIIRKKGEPLKVFLPKQLRESVTRLSVPRISVLPEAKDIKLHQQAQFKHESSSKHLPLTKYPSSLAEEFDTSNTAENEDSIPKADITVFGVSLENFNKPRSVAIEVMKAKQVPLKSNKWIYPVPNPSKWK